MSAGNFSEMSMLDLFRAETDNQAKLLTAGLLALERVPTDARELEACMRAAHSLKGAARIVDRPAAAAVAHAMEDCFVAAQERRSPLTPARIDRLLEGVDLLSRIAQESDEVAAAKSGVGPAEIDAWTTALAAAAGAELALPARQPTAVAAAPASAAPAPTSPPPAAAPAPADAAGTTHERADRVLRVTAENVDRLLGLAGESLVEARWVKPFASSLLRLKRLHHELGRDLDAVRDALAATPQADAALSAHAKAKRRVQECTGQLNERLVELDHFDRRSANLSHRLYDEALAVRLRPFADGLHGFARMVRDVGRGLGKEVRLEVRGEDVAVDRDILEKLEAPLSHLLRNAVDHGIESPGERAAAGKAAEGVIRLEARHSAGRLHLTVSDDGRGIDLDRLRETVAARKLSNAETLARMSESEVLEFLFLPGFSLREAVTEISGRGVGLDVVHSVVKSLRGTVRIATEPGRGVRFDLQLPLTLSVVRALLVEVGGEPYAFPLASIRRTLKVAADAIGELEGKPHFALDGRRTTLVAADRVLEVPPAKPTGDLPVVVIGEGARTYGVAVDRLLGERELVVRPLDPRLGKVRDVAAAALTEEGTPVLIFDLEDLAQSIDKLVAAGRLGSVQAGSGETAGIRRKRVLIVDDSLTVRELERKLLGARGYAVEVAVDGMDGWNAARAGRFDLVVTDVDMPRMDGIELVTLIKRDPNLKATPVMIVSYKDREIDRKRGLDAGADYYLTKGSFHDETLLDAVIDLIGEAGA